MLCPSIEGTRPRNTNHTIWDLLNSNNESPVNKVIKKIVIEATEQSNQMSPPEILEITKLKDFLKNLEETTKLLFADVNSKDNLSFEKLKNFKSLCILIGPEGDFSPSERQSILSFSQVVPFTMSKNILRSDTAVISAISLVNFINNYP